MELLTVKDLRVHFKRKGRLVKAVDGVDFFLKKGLITSLAGESGCGKTTLARTILKFNPIKKGTILFNDQDLSLAKNEKILRRNIQIVFQNPYLSVDPRFKVYDVLYEAIAVFGRVDKLKAKEIISKTLEDVELSSKLFDRYSHELSGGQLQRLCIARAIVNKPAVIICDEPTSSLDVTTASKIIKLIKRLRIEYNSTFLFISHNLKLLRKAADFCFIMLDGKIVEYGPKKEIYASCGHPYTNLLLEASNFKVKDFAPRAKSCLSGCVFIDRCPKKSKDCQKQPPAKRISPEHVAYCWNI